MLLNCGVGEDSWESPLGCKEIQPVNTNRNQSWIFIGRFDTEAETPILWPPDAKNSLIWKDRDAGKDWRWKEKGTTQDEMVGWHHRLDGHEFEQAPGVGDGQGSLACCGPWGRKESDMTEWLNWLSDPPLFPHPTPPGHHRAPDWAPFATQQLPASQPAHTWQCVYVDATFSIHPTISLPHCVHKAILYIYVSMPSLKMGSPIPFSRFYIYVLIYYICFSHSDLLQSVLQALGSWWWFKLLIHFQTISIFVLPVLQRDFLNSFAACVCFVSP